MTHRRAVKEQTIAINLNFNWLFNQGSKLSYYNLAISLAFISLSDLLN